MLLPNQFIVYNLTHFCSNAISEIAINEQRQSSAQNHSNIGGQLIETIRQLEKVLFLIKMR